MTSTMGQQTASAQPSPTYEDRVSALRGQYAAIAPGDPVRLAKRTSNLFRPRQQASTPGLDVAAFDGVLSVDPSSRTAVVQGMTTYEHLVAATLPHGLVPLCVPQLRTITLGGAVTGLGIESASWRNGCPHESVLSMDVMTGAGDVLTVTRDAADPHADLFHGFPNSYGSLGYALSLTIELEPAAPYVRLRHIPVGDARGAAQVLAEVCRDGAWDGERVDFVDGTVFSPTEAYVSLGRYEQNAAGQTPSDRTKDSIYYRSVQSERTDLLTTHDYLWRWDTDWFWCSRAFGAQNPTIRKLWPAKLLRSDVYWKLIALDRRTSFSTRLDAARRRPPREHVVQDIEVPVDRLAEFLDFFHREVGIEPVWLCPLRQRDPDQRWPLYQLDPGTTYINVGFWSTVGVPNGVDPADGRVNRRIEQVVAELGGRKSLYSTAFYPREEFDRLYGGTEYRELKDRYDPEGRLLGLYEKTVGRR
ncbi:MAG TPA: FAD-binding oxidoreductase [Candidatus Nanopelagicales bacterium]